MTLNASIVASAEHIASVEHGLRDRFGQTFMLRALSLALPIPEEVLTRASVLVVEIDTRIPQSIARIAQAREARPDLLLIAAVAEMDVSTVKTLIRRGVNDVVSLPFDVEELFASIMDLGSARAVSRDDLAPMVGIVHSSGGIGASTLASHLAVELAQTKPDLSCCMVDLDLQFGELASLFGKQPVTSMIDLLETGDRLDADILRNAAVEVRPGVSLLAAPDVIVPPEEIDTDGLLNLLGLIRREYGFVLLDLPSDWTNWALSAACACEDLYLVVDQSLRSLRRARKSLALLESVEFPRDNVKLVVNRAEKRLFQTIGTGDVAEALRRDVAAALPLQKSGLQEAQDQGLLLGETDPRAPYAKAVTGFALQILGEGE